ncbi:hypothetical protein AgCh_026392 [Apium graveolens]
MVTVHCWPALRITPDQCNILVGYCDASAAAVPAPSSSTPVISTVDHISMPCRREINLITRQCWPALFTALGITPEECNIIVRFCEPSSGSSAPGPPVWYPTPPAKMENATLAKGSETKAP